MVMPVDVMPSPGEIGVRAALVRVSVVPGSWCDYRCFRHAGKRKSEHVTTLGSTAKMPANQNR
jgi:hypothetical protein